MLDNETITKYLFVFLQYVILSEKNIISPLRSL